MGQLEPHFGETEISNIKRWPRTVALQPNTNDSELSQFVFVFRENNSFDHVSSLWLQNNIKEKEYIDLWCYKKLIDNIHLNLLVCSDLFLTHWPVCLGTYVLLHGYGGTTSPPRFSSRLTLAAMSGYDLKGRANRSASLIIDATIFHHLF